MAQYVNVLSTINPNCLRKLQLIFDIELPTEELPSDLDFALGEVSDWESLDECITSERFTGLESVQVDMELFRHRGAENLRSKVHFAMAIRLPKTHETRKLVVSSSIV